MSQLSLSPKPKSLALILLVCLLGFTACQDGEQEATAEDPNPETQATLAFQSRQIIDSAAYWWAHCPADVNNDGITDLVFIHNNSSGGYLGYYAGQQDTGIWKLNIIADQAPGGTLFAGGDLECADIDGDGDMDVLAIEHPGEWTDAGAPAKLYWYENPEWQMHPIGEVPDAVKDVSFTDFDKDGKMDLSVLTFDESTLSVFRQKGYDQWERVQFYNNFMNLHEGMAVGDLNGDTYDDIVADGIIFYNPAKDLTSEWVVENMDEKWNTQTGDWSRNGTKAFIRDITGDGKGEVFISHSERAGYPLSWYQQQDGKWQENIISDSIPACHTLQVFDFDNDGDQDVLAGINWARAVNLNKDQGDVTLFLNGGDNQSWEAMVLDTDGVYNGQAADYDGDGDLDIFRYPNHESTKLFLLENTLQ